MSLGKIIDYLKVKRYDWEIVVADDGSVDKTKDLIKNLTHKNKRIKLVRLPQNKGKGGALKKGILAAKGKYIIFMDADLSVDLGNIDIFLKQLKKESPVVIASRRVKGAEIEVHQPWHREVMGRVFTFLTRILMQVNVADFTCGFKGFTNEAAKKIFSKSLINRWAYDAEIMFLSNKFGYKIRQMDLLKIRLNDLRGVYD